MLKWLLGSQMGEVVAENHLFRQEGRRKDAALAANDDRRNDRQRKIDRRSFAQPSLERNIPGKRDDFTLLIQGSKQKRVKIKIECGILPTIDGRLLGCRRQRDVRAFASIADHGAHGRELRGWDRVIRAASHRQVVVLSMTMRAAVRFEA